LLAPYKVYKTKWLKYSSFIWYQLSY
jgi:hypothetical protein